MKTKSDFWPRLANDALEIVVSIGFIPGVIAGFFLGGIIMGSWVRHPAERYTVTKIGPTVLRMDTSTGQSWLFNGGWLAIKESTNVPLTFVPDQPNPVLPDFGK